MARKTKRVNTKRVLESESAARRRIFFESGAPGSILLLLLFIGMSSLILSLGGYIDDQGNHLIWPSLGRYMINWFLMLFMGTALGLYVVLNEPRVIKNHLRGTLLLFVLFIMMGFVRLSVVQKWPDYVAVMPVMITGITFTIAYNQRFALGIGSFLALICAMSIADTAESFHRGLGILLASGGGTGIAVLLLKRIRSFTRLIEVCVLAAGMVFILIFVVGIWEQSADGTTIYYQKILRDCGYGAGGTVFVGLIMQALLPIIERLFRTASDMTLLSYGEATQPLLKRLAIEAPGTFNHSWQIGMLAESAAESIGANGLLCRVGSYYHDVGKLNKPRYFVENQEGQMNQHKLLSPTMSRMIIVGHVKDGLEMLREYRIPKILHQFTATHHGTTLVEYFYHEATKNEEKTGQKVEETEFRYPGPKPQTRESAIVMLADAVEGATRAMKEPTPSRIENIVHLMAMKRLQDGQFNECDLTMKELNRIETSLTKSLCAMYHGRIAYPTRLDADPSKDTKSSAGLEKNENAPNESNEPSQAQV